MRLLVLSIVVLNCLAFIRCEESPTTTQTSLSVENIENDLVHENIEIRNSIANKPFLTISGDSPKPTTERSPEDRKTSTTTNKPKLSVYALINAKKQTKKAKGGKCSCFGETSTIIRYIKVLNDDLELGDGGNLDCGQPTDASNRCEQLCREKVSADCCFFLLMKYIEIHCNTLKYVRHFKLTTRLTNFIIIIISFHSQQC